MNKRALPLLLVAALAAAACASTTVAAGNGPDSPISTSVPPGSGTPPPGKPKFVTPQQGLQNVLPTTWIKAVPSRDGMTVAIWFWGSPCLGVVDPVKVDETPQKVTVTLSQGTPPSQVGSACIEIALLSAVRIQLQSPLGDRTVVDGTKTNT